MRLRNRDRGAAAAQYARAPLPARRTPWRQARWCALDFELTGLDPRHDEIVSYGAIPIEDGRVQLRGAVSSLVRPARESREASIRVHGLRTADLARAPGLADAIGPLLRALTGRILVVHTAAVEHAFLGRALKRLGVRLRGPLVDTEVLGRLWQHDREGHAPRQLDWVTLPPRCICRPTGHTTRWATRSPPRRCSSRWRRTSTGRTPRPWRALRTRAPGSRPIKPSMSVG